MLLKAWGAAAVVTAAQAQAKASAALAAVSRHATTCTRLYGPYDLYCVRQHTHTH